jgi:hypothetical protein
MCAQPRVRGQINKRRKKCKGHPKLNKSFR